MPGRASWRMHLPRNNACLPGRPGLLRAALVVALQILCMHGGLSPELKSLEQIKRITRPTDVPDSGLLCDLLWADPDKDIQGWGENDRGVSYTFGPDCVTEFLQKHDLDLVCRAHQVCGATNCGRACGAAAAHMRAVPCCAPAGQGRAAGSSGHKTCALAAPCTHTQLPCCQEMVPHALFVCRVAMSQDGHSLLGQTRLHCTLSPTSAADSNMHCGYLGPVAATGRHAAA